MACAFHLIGDHDLREAAHWTHLDLILEPHNLTELFVDLLESRQYFAHCEKSRFSSVFTLSLTLRVEREVKFASGEESSVQDLKTNSPTSSLAKSASPSSITLSIDNSRLS